MFYKLNCQLITFALLYDKYIGKLLFSWKYSNLDFFEEKIKYITFVWSQNYYLNNKVYGLNI